MGPGMSDQLGKDVPSATAQAWDSVRRVREPVAWILLAVAAIAVFVSALQLFDLAGVQVPLAPGPGVVPTFAMRAAVVAPQFVAGGIFVLPLLSVILVSFAGGPTSRARQVVQAAAWIQAVTLGLGVISWAGALGTDLRPGVWFIFDATDLAAVVAALIFTVAVVRSQALRPVAQLMDPGDGDEDYGDDHVDFGDGV
jgi:hypothetical protein